MIDAEKGLVDAFLADYCPSLCLIAPGHEIEVDVGDWVRENAPDWLEESPDLLLITTESARGINIDHLGLPTDVRNALRRLRIYNVGQVLDNYGHLGYGPDEMLDFPGIGEESICEVNEALERIGVQVGQDRVGAP